MTFVDSFEIYDVKRMRRIGRVQASLSLGSSCSNNEANYDLNPAKVLEAAS